MSILAIIVAAVIITIALSGALSPPQTFAVFFHVYDQTKAPNPESVTDLGQLVSNVTISVSGPRSFTSFLESGISPEPEQLPQGDYQITATRAGYSATPISYVVGSNCERRDPGGTCHVWIAMQPS